MVTKKNNKLAILGGKPVRKNFLELFRPVIGKEEIKEVVDTLKSDWISTGPKVQIFEEQMKKYIGCKHAISLNSCTAGLHLALIAAGVGEGDEVITSPFTFTATANVILHVGAKPVFVDIKKDTYNIDPDLIEEAITKKTKAIIPVHYGGHPCDMDAILDIAKKYKLIVIEDAAHAIGSKYKGKKIGTISDFTAFSFYATKNMTTAEGGMVCLNDDEAAEKIRILRLHGMNRDAWKRYSHQSSWYYEVKYPGYKYNMTDIQASLGIHQLKKLKGFIAKRKKIVKFYNKNFSNLAGISVADIKDYIHHSHHLYTILIDLTKLKIRRSQFFKALKAENIGVNVHFIPVHLHPYYEDNFGFKRGDFPNAEYIFDRILTLPLYPSMTATDAEDVVKAVKKIVEYYGNSKNKK